MNTSKSGSLTSVPNGHIIDFETAELRKPAFQDGLYLLVRGQLPVGNFEARLAPRVYHDRPDYWGIEVAVVAAPETNGGHTDGETLGGTGSGSGAHMFENSVPLSGIIGNRGIMVIGANQVKRIEIVGESLGS
jgi:hypothetical protein